MMSNDTHNQILHQELSQQVYESKKEVETNPLFRFLVS